MRPPADFEATPAVQQASLGEMGGQQSLSTRGSSNNKVGGVANSTGRRTRPISAYPIQGQNLLMVSESVESS